MTLFRNFRRPSLATLPVLLFAACDAQQPQVTCAALPPPSTDGYSAKYTVESSTGDGCGFLGTVTNDKGQLVTGEPLSVTMYGTDGSLKLGIHPVLFGRLDNTDGVAVGDFNEDPTQCSAATLSVARATIDDPDLGRPNSGNPSNGLAKADVQYTFTNVRFDNSPNILNRRLSAKLELMKTPAATGGEDVRSCTAVIDVQAYYYTNQDADDEKGLRCETDADCQKASFTLPSHDFQCVTFIRAAGIEQNEAEEAVPRNRCVPKTAME